MKSENLLRIQNTFKKIRKPFKSVNQTLIKQDKLNLKKIMFLRLNGAGINTCDVKYLFGLLFFFVLKGYWD